MATVSEHRSNQDRRFCWAGICQFMVTHNSHNSSKKFCSSSKLYQNLSSSGNTVEMEVKKKWDGPCRSLGYSLWHVRWTIDLWWHFYAAISKKNFKDCTHSVVDVWIRNSARTFKPPLFLINMSSERQKMPENPPQSMHAKFRGVSSR